MNKHRQELQPRTLNIEADTGPLEADLQHSKVQFLCMCGRCPLHAGALRLLMNLSSRSKACLYCKNVLQVLGVSNGVAGDP